MSHKCSKCKYLKVTYEFDTEYLCTVATEKCLKKNKLFNTHCNDFFKKKDEKK